MEERILLDVAVKLVLRGRLECLFGPGLVAQLQVAIGDAIRCVLSELVLFARSHSETGQGGLMLFQLLPGVPNLIREVRGVIRSLGALPSRVQMQRRLFVIAFAVPGIAKQTRNFSTALLGQSAGGVKQGRSVGLQFIVLPRGVQELGDVQGDEFGEARFLRDPLETVQRDLRLAIQVGDVSEVILGGRLEVTGNFKHLEQLHPCFLVLLALKVAVPQLEPVLVPTLLGQFPWADLEELLNGLGVVATLVVVIGQFPASFQGEGTFGESLHEGLDAVRGVLVVERHRTHGGVVGCRDVGLARRVFFVCQSFKGMEGQRKLVVLERLHGPVPFNLTRVHGVGPLRRRDVGCHHQPQGQGEGDVGLPMLHVVVLRVFPQN